MAQTDGAATDNSHRWLSWVRLTAVGVLLVVACTALTGYVAAHWAERQVLNTDNWVALVGPLPQKPVVSNALGNYVTDQVFTAVPIEDKIRDALPPKASFLAKPLTSQLQTITANTSKKLVASDQFQAIWIGANRIAMNRLVSQARGQPTELQKRVDQKFNIDISSLKGGLSKALGTSATAIPALEPASTKAVAISTDLHAKRERIHDAVRLIDLLAVTLPLLIIACFLWALAWARNRRQSALVAFTLVIIFMLIELIVIKWLRQETLNQVKNSANIPAISYIFDILVAWLRSMTYWVIGISAVIIALLLVSGPTAWAGQLRHYVRLDRIRESRPLVMWREARVWVRSYEYYIWLGAVVLIFILLALADKVSGRVVINHVLALLSIFAAIHIMATPHWTRLQAVPAVAKPAATRSGTKRRKKS